MLVTRSCARRASRPRKRNPAKQGARLRATRLALVLLGVLNHLAAAQAGGTRESGPATQRAQQPWPWPPNAPLGAPDEGLDGPVVVVVTARARQVRQRAHVAGASGGARARRRSRRGGGRSWQRSGRGRLRRRPVRDLGHLRAAAARALRTAGCAAAASYTSSSSSPPSAPSSAAPQRSAGCAACLRVALAHAASERAPKNEFTAASTLPPNACRRAVACASDAPVASQNERIAAGSIAWEGALVLS